MNQPEVGYAVDPILLPFLSTGNEREAAQHLNELVACATPAIANITRSSRTPDDAFQEAAHHVVRQLREMRAHRNGTPIGNYLRYARVVASRVVKGQVRQEHPGHRSLVDSLRHILNRTPALALWESQGQRLCGFAAWRHQQSGSRHSERLTRLLNEPGTHDRIGLLAQDAAYLNHRELVTKLFEWIGHPVRFDELTKIVCGVRQVKDPGYVGDEPGGRVLSDWLPDPRCRPDEDAEWREFLHLLWTNIQQLPPFQRIAYLLNFTAADGQLEMFSAYGIASIREIGAVLQISEEQFSHVWPTVRLSDEMNSRVRESHNYDQNFAILWQYLPLTDSAIAILLGTERQKVINLRKTAANRLSRSMMGAKPARLSLS